MRPISYEELTKIYKRVLFKTVKVNTKFIYCNDIPLLLPNFDIEEFQKLSYENGLTALCLFSKTTHKVGKPCYFYADSKVWIEKNPILITI